MFFLEFCTNPYVLRVFYFASFFVDILKVLIPICLIILISVDLAKGVIDPDNKKNNIMKKTINRLVAAIVIFILPWIVDVVMNIVNEKTDYNSCIANAKPEKIEEFQKEYDDKIKAEDDKKKEEQEHKKDESSKEEDKNEPESNGNPEIHIKNGTQAEELVGLSNSEFIKTIGPLASLDYTRTGVLASVTIAQAIYETGWGDKPVPNSNNYFNVICTKGWPRCAESGGVSYRAYDSVEDSFLDHAKVLRQDNFKEIVTKSTYQAQIQVLQKGGYTTAENYFTTMCKIIEDNHLTKFDVKVDPNQEYKLQIKK